MSYQLQEPPLRVEIVAMHFHVLSQLIYPLSQKSDLKGCRATILLMKPELFYDGVFPFLFQLVLQSVFMYTTKANYSKESHNMQTKLVRGFPGFYTVMPLAVASPCP